MSEMMTIEEMAKKYDGYWVLIGDPVTDDMQRVLAGRVLFHSTDRDEVYRKVTEYPPGHYAYDCFIPIPKDTIFVL
jgi:hypothetical protein